MRSSDKTADCNPSHRLQQSPSAAQALPSDRKLAHRLVSGSQVDEQHSPSAAHALPLVRQLAHWPETWSQVPEQQSPSAVQALRDARR